MNISCVLVYECSVFFLQWRRNKRNTMYSEMKNMREREREREQTTKKTVFKDEKNRTMMVSQNFVNV